MNPSFRSSDRRLRGNLFTAAALIAPIVLVIASRQIIGLQPATSQAAPTTTDPLDPQVTSNTVFKPAQRKLIAYLASASQVLPALVSPMDHPPAPAEPPISAPLQPPTPDKIETHVAEARPQLPLSLSGVMSGSDPASALVMIGGKVFRLGDEVTPGWTLVSIDARTIAAVLKGPEGQAFTVARDRR